MKIRTAISIVAITAALAGTPAMAAISFSTGFDGPALDANLATTYAGTGTALTVGGTAAFTGGNIWAGTVGSDYAVSTNDWTATIEVSGSADYSRYFGLGTGTTAGTGEPYWEAPQGLAGDPVAYVNMYGAGFFDGGDRSLQSQRKVANAGYWTGETNYTDAAFDAAVGTSGGISNSAFYRYTMAYDYSAQTLTFDIAEITAFGGTVVYPLNTANVAVMSLAGMGFDGSNGKIFFGGNNSTFDNLSINVIPEPSTALLGGLGMLALLRRRR